MNTRQPPAPGGKQPPVGIDLGTTYSVLACLDATGRPVTVVNGQGDLLTPSAVLCDGDDIVVGREAVRSSSLSPDLYAECFKRDMGEASFRQKIRGIDVPPEVLSAFVLDRLKRDAEQRLGPISRVVITVPAFFDATRRKATQEAGRLAGLEVLDIINEPTAAAVVFGYNQGFLDLSRPAGAPSGTMYPWSGSAAGPQRVMVYDLGGGTFDVTILEIEGTRFRALATDGDVRLGGKDFDQRLVDHLAEKFLSVQGVDPRSDPQDAAQLWIEAQEAKQALSERSKASVVCFHAGIRMRIDVTRGEFEELIRDLVERTETTTSLVVRKTGLEWPEIDRLLLIGGSSRIPMVRDMLARLSGKEPDRSQSADEAVAHGAALYAGMLMGQSSVEKPGCELVNVNSHSLGVVGTDPKTGEKLNVILIPKDTPLPCRAVRSFKTARPDQRNVRVAVVEGESHRPEACIPLGECVVRDLPAGLPQGTPIEVEYRYATNGLLAVSARIPSARISTQVDIKRHDARDLGDLATWRKRLLGQAASTGEKTFAAAAGQEVQAGLNDRSSVMKRLDALYEKVGEAAAKLTLPAVLARSQATAVAARGEAARARANCAEAERARKSVVDRADIIRLDAQLAQARTEQKQKQVRADFARLVLGRECINAGFCPPRLEPDVQEIRQLRERMGQ